MENEELVSVLEALLFASGKEVSLNTLSDVLDIDKKDIKDALEVLKQNLIDRKSGIQLVQMNDSYQLATLEKYYAYVCKLLDNRPKPNLSPAALEVLSIIAYNQNSTRAEIEKIRGVSSDSALNKLLEYNLVEEAGKSDLPGKPMMYKTTNEFLKTFGYTKLEDLPPLPTFEEATAEVENESNDSEETIIDKTEE
ncbi:MAG: SMC-Scp complex subunit ScpB [Clostridia bacterium]|nr:SMC-Scp complex subunit ScpB [Clostridia bacterium]